MSALKPFARNFNRRRFLKTLGIGVGLAAWGIRPLWAEDAPAKRRVWLWADAHIGLEADGKDGGEWAELSTAELLRNVAPCDYAVIMGDMTHAGDTEQFERYVKLRQASKIERWYELVGNHDFCHGIASGDYAKFVRPEQRYVLLDGNLAWIFVSAEQTKAAGILKPTTREWLTKVLEAHQKRNIVVCSHQSVSDTIRKTHRKEFEREGLYLDRVLSPVPWVEELRKKFRIDAWLSGHEHHAPRDANQFKKIGATTFINVASLGRAYGTKACNSFVFEMKAGEKTIDALCRDHDKEKYVDGLGGRIGLEYPLEFSKELKIVDVDPTPVVVPAAK